MVGCGGAWFWWVGGLRIDGLSVAYCLMFSVTKSFFFRCRVVHVLGEVSFQTLDQNGTTASVSNRHIFHLFMYVFR